MNEINKTLYIPLFGKAQVSRKNVILRDEKAEEIWEQEAFPITGRAKSKWLAYFMAMRARVFDDWTCSMLRQNENALVLHIGCGLDSRCLRVKEHCAAWIDADFPDVILQRRKYFEETENYHMETVDAARADDIMKLPDSPVAVVVLEGISMYLTNGELRALISALQDKYDTVHLLMDVYTEFAAKMSKHRNPIKEVGATKVYGVSDVGQLVSGTKIKVIAEHSMTPDVLVGELKGLEGAVFRRLYAGKMGAGLYKLYEMST